MSVGNGGGGGKGDVKGTLPGKMSGDGVWEWGMLSTPDPAKYISSEVGVRHKGELKTFFSSSVISQTFCSTKKKKKKDTCTCVTFGSIFGRFWQNIEM